MRGIFALPSKKEYDKKKNEMAAKDIYSPQTLLS